MTISGCLCVWQTGKYENTHVQLYAYIWTSCNKLVSNCVWMYINKNEFLAGKRICHK